MQPLRQIEPYKSNKEACDEVVENTQESRESVAIQPVIEKQNHTVKNFGTVGYVLPRSEFLRGMADAVTTGDEDHGYRRNLGNLLGVLPRFAGQIHGGKAEGLRGVTDDGLQGGIRRSWLRI